MNSIFIKELRVKTRLNKTEFANKIGVGVSTVTNWEKGKTEPHFVNQKAIRAIFKDFITKDFKQSSDSMLPDALLY